MENLEIVKRLVKDFHDEIIRKVDLIESDNAHTSLNFYEASIDQSVTSHFKMVHRLRRRFVKSKDLSALKEKRKKKEKSSVKIIIEEVKDKENNKERKILSSSAIVSDNSSCTSSYEQLNRGSHNNKNNICDGKISVNSLELETL